MSTIKTVCVYCGSGPGTNPRFVEAAIAFGKVLAENGVGLVYGGGSIGLMGAVATSVLDHGGFVTGIIPDFLTSRENALARVQEMVVTHDMHERKRLMFERSDAFVALPGGIGTLEELVEQLTWQQLGRHTKPILLADIDGFWEPLLVLLAHMRATQFIRPTLTVDILKAERVEDILPRLRAAAGRHGGRHQADGASSGASPVAAPAINLSRLVARECHGFNAVAIGIDDERRVIAHAIVRPQRGRTFRRTSCRKRRGMKSIDLIGRFRAKADVSAAARRDRLHAAAQIDPYFGIRLAESDHRWTCHEAR